MLKGPLFLHNRDIPMCYHILIYSDVLVSPDILGYPQISSDILVGADMTEHPLISPNILVFPGKPDNLGYLGIMGYPDILGYP